MVYNFPQTNIRLCLKENNIPEYIIDIIVKNYNNTYYIHKLLEESIKYHKRRLKSGDNYALNFHIRLFNPNFIRFNKECDYEHNGENYTVIHEVVPDNLINLKIRTSNLLLNWTKHKKELQQIGINEGNIYICAGKAIGHWFNTIQEQQRNLVSTLESFELINENNLLMFVNGHGEPLYPLTPCVKCRLYENNIINITIRNH